MAEFPALPLWTDALIGDTYHLRPAEFGAYMRLLICAWRSPDCALPNDDAMLGRMIGDTKNWHRIKSAVLPFFHERDGKLVQKRLLREREYVSAKSQSQSAKAKARWLKNKGSVYAVAIPNGCQTDAPIPTPIKIKNKNDEKGSVILNASDPRWNACKARYFKETGKKINANTWPYPSEWPEAQIK